MRYFRAQTGNSKTGFLAYGALLTLALFQLGFAVHQVTHDGTEPLESCAACSVYNQLEDVPVSASTSSIVFYSFAAHLPQGPDEAFETLSQGILIRGPPAA